MKKKISIKEFACRFLAVLNRYSHFLDLILLYFFAKYLYARIDNSFNFLVYALPILQAWNICKWEWRVFKSNALIRTTARNKRVQGFSGSQGAGKTSFMLHTIYTIKAKDIFTNFPCRIRKKFSNKLSKEVLNLNEKISDGSVCAIDEATMLFNNRLVEMKDKEVLDDMFAQQLHQQIIRHMYDGNLFYSSVDLTRLPQMLKDNIGLTNYMLGQGSVKVSYISSVVIAFVGKLFGLNLRNSIRYWDCQQLERIPEQGYTFDLSRQEKDVNDKNYANLIRFCAWSANNRFDYDDRFLRGLYSGLPDCKPKQWYTLEYSEKDLKDIGYGHLIDFFGNRKHGKYQRTANADSKSK